MLNEFYISNNNLAINECLSNPCLNGKCIDLHGSYKCICHNGFNGTNCQKGKFNADIFYHLLDNRSNYCVCYYMIISTKNIYNVDKLKS